MAFDSDLNNTFGEFFSKDSASATETQDARISLAKIEAYKPNGFIAFLSSRRFYTLVAIYVVAVGYSLIEFDWYMASVTLVGLAPFFVPLLIAKFVYPLHHLKKYLKSNNLEDAIRNDRGQMLVARAVYNTLPKKSTQKYLSSLNKEAAQMIDKICASK
ncbi:MAG: hypothetical protein ACI4BI_00755 [Anaerotardibacter sp.]